jgi:hypothetical protein
LAFDVNHIVIPSHSHRSSEPQKVKLPNRESKEDLQKRLRWFLNFLTLDFIGILRYSNLHYQIRKDKRVHFHSCVPLASCHCSSYLLFKLPASRTLDEDEFATIQFAVVERFPDQKLKFSHLLAGFGYIFCGGNLQSGRHHA